MKIFFGKTFFGILIFCFAFSILNFSAYAKCKEEEEFVVTGTALGGENDSIATTKEASRVDAKRRASERAGVLLRAKTTLDLGLVKESRIESFTSAQMKVLDEKTTYKVGGIGALVASTTLEVSICQDDFEDYFKDVLKAELTEEEKEKEIQFTFGVFALRRGEEIRLKDYDTVFSGEEFWIEFTPMQDCHVYLLNETPDGEIQPMFPHRDVISDTKVFAGKTVRLPSDSQNFQADKTTGTERIHFIASVKELTDLEFLLTKIKVEKENAVYKNILKDEVRGVTKSRGLAQVVDSDEKTPDAKKLNLDILKQYGSLSKTLVLKHK